MDLEERVRMETEGDGENSYKQSRRKSYRIEGSRRESEDGWCFYRGEAADGVLKCLQIIQHHLSSEQGEILQAAPLHYTKTHRLRLISLDLSTVALH